MNLNLSESGTIVTFYSYKGGTGRSMAVANVAYLLARQAANSSHRVLVMDWDLEAPGLHRFLAERMGQPADEDRPGVIDYFHTLRALLEKEKRLYKKMIGDPEGWQILDERLPLQEYLIDVGLGLDFMKAGRVNDPQYPQRVGSFDWVDFYNEYGGVIRVFRELLAAKYTYCLIDSRTGISDISGVCTTLLPQKLVAVFTPNRQSLFGLRHVVEQAVAYRRASDDFRPLAVFPLPSRIEEAEQKLKAQWRTTYQQEFQDLFRRVYELKQCSLAAYFDEVQLPHVGYYAYGEHIAVLEERGDVRSLSRAYQTFSGRLAEFDFAWEETVEDRLGLAIESLEQDLAVARQTEDRHREGNVLGNLGDAHLALDEPRRAVNFYEQARLTFRDIDDLRGQGYALANLSNAHLAMGDIQGALEYQQQYLKIAQEIGDRHWEGNALGNLGNVYLEISEVNQAIECYQQALKIFQEIDDRSKEAGALSGLGLAYLALGQTQRAIEFYEQHLSIAGEIGDHRSEGEALGNLASVYADLGESERAIEFYRKLIANARQLNDADREALGLFRMGEVLYELGRRDQAIANVETALKIYQQLDDADTASIALERLARWRQ